MTLQILLLAACGAAPEPADPPASHDTAAAPAPPGASESEVGQAETPEATPDARPRKMMRIAHLRDAMEQVSGGAAWTVGGESGWDAYAETLGVPDLQSSLEESREAASVMLQKFLDDAANATCEEWLAREIDAGEGPGGLFFGEIAPDDTNPDAVRANLVHLRWQITGRERGSHDPVVDAYADLFDLVMQRTADPTAAWTTVCVGLFTHPDFYTY